MQVAAALFLVAFIGLLIVSGDWVYLVGAVVVLAIVGAIQSNISTDGGGAQNKKSSEVPSGKGTKETLSGNELKVADASQSQKPLSQQPHKKRWSRARKRRHMMKQLRAREYRRLQKGKAIHHVIPNYMSHEKRKVA